MSAKAFCDGTTAAPSSRCDGSAPLRDGPMAADDDDDDDDELYWHHDDDAKSSTS